MFNHVDDVAHSAFFFIIQERGKEEPNDMTIMCIELEDSRQGKIYMQIVEAEWNHVDKYSWRGGNCTDSKEENVRLRAIVAVLLN